MTTHQNLLTLILLTWLSVGVQGQEQSPISKTREEPATGEITGKVVNETGQPLAGAAVLVRSANNRLGGRSTTADSEGNFRVAGLEAGLYSVGANAPAYTSGVDPILATTYYRIGDNVRLEMVRGGAITGMVTNAFGEPVIGVRVRATMIRDVKGQAPKMPSFAFLDLPTDDRGIYRLFGLTPGIYLVSAGGSGFSPIFNPYESDVPTYSPSSTRDNAAEVSVRTGEDSTADIRYRGEPGHSISGSVKVVGTNAAQVTLTPAGSFLPVGSALQFPGGRGFAFNGLADGDYDLVAQEVVTAQSPTPLLSFSETKRITIKGASVSGVELVPRPLASVSGRITLESSKAPECQGKRPPLLAETLVQMHRPEKEADLEWPYLRLLASAGSPDSSGSFSLFNLQPGKYQFDPRFYARYWYLDSITLGAPPVTAVPKSQTAGPRTDVAANWTTLKAGEQVNNLTIRLAQGAASIRGRLPLEEGAAFPAGMAVYLVPVEPEKTEDVLRFFVAEVAADGTFTLNNLPPGKYRLLAQISEPQLGTVLKLREPEAATARVKLRKSAETKKAEIELKPCQNVTEYQVKQ
jgi:hypothetical protein